VSLPKDAQLWFDIQVETLRRVHSSWLPGIAPELLVQARRLALGRRWLANRLATVSPVLFGLPSELGPEAITELRSASWLTPIVADAIESALDLGSLAMAATVRTLVNRSDVIKLRGVLGPKRYARALAAPVDNSQGLIAITGGNHDILDQLIRCGATELALYADSLHPAWGESVRLTFERAWWLDPPTPSLTPAAAEACLRRTS
jgi:hypothetical protein